MRPNFTVDSQGQWLAIDWLDQHLNLPAFWLRDNGQGPQTRDEKNGQRLVDQATFPANLKITKAEGDQRGLHIVFSDGESWFSWDYLTSLGAKKTAEIELFYGQDLTRLPIIGYSPYMQDDTALLAWLKDFSKFGFGRIDNGPVNHGDLFRIIDRFGFVRETNYGRHFEVRTEPNPTNLAYTGLGLPPHTDNPYRNPVPTLQLLYCLENSATGGDSGVVDGFAVANALRDEQPNMFKILSQTTVSFAYEGQSGVHLEASRPLIETDENGELIAVCYNTRSMQATYPREGLDLAAFSAAYHRFGQLINDQKFRVEFRLNPGECFLLNNTRVLHARRAFQADGHRWLQGAYADFDSLYSKMRSLEKLI